MVGATDIIDVTLYLTLPMKGLKMTVYVGESGNIQNVLFLNKII